MSRIHEALKQAEQERAASQGGHVGCRARSGSPVRWTRSPMLGVPSRRPQLRAPASGQSLPSFTNPFTFDTLLARCAQSSGRRIRRPCCSSTRKRMRAARNSSARCARASTRCARSFRCKKMLVTSALPKEGKSFVAANLAQVLVRQHGRRVLLIDGDLRVPSLHTVLGTTSSPGLAEYLARGNRRVLGHAARADGEPVLHSRWTQRSATGRTGRQRPPEGADAAGRAAV